MQLKNKIAVVGLGFMGVTHLRAYLQNSSARIAAVCDSVRLPVNGVLAGVAGNVKKSDDIHLGPQIVRAMHRQADAEVDHLMVLDVLRGAPGDLQAVERAHTATTRST